MGFWRRYQRWWSSACCDCTAHSRVTVCVAGLHLQVETGRVVCCLALPPQRSSLFVCSLLSFRLAALICGRCPPLATIGCDVPMHFKKRLTYSSLNGSVIRERIEIYARSMSSSCSMQDLLSMQDLYVCLHCAHILICSLMS